MEGYHHLQFAGSRARGGDNLIGAIHGFAFDQRLERKWNGSYQARLFLDVLLFCFKIKHGEQQR